MRDRTKAAQLRMKSLAPSEVVTPKPERAALKALLMLANVAMDAIEAANSNTVARQDTTVPAIAKGAKHALPKLKTGARKVKAAERM